MFGSGLARPAGSLVVGDRALWLIDLRALSRGRRERLELALFGGLRLVLDTMAHVWDESRGRGALGLNHAGYAAAALHGHASRRNRADFTRELRGFAAACLDRLRHERGWQTSPLVLNLGL